MTQGLLFPRHLRRAKICFNGGRQWFAQRGWSWNDFVANGRDLDQFRATGCPLAARAVAAAEAEEAENGR